MKTNTSLWMSFGVVCLLLACAGEPVDEAPGREVAAPSAQGLVQVAATGSTFDPPVKPAQIPPGAWMCEMATVHYASMQAGDGKCPTCGMALTQKAGAAAAPAGHAEHAGDAHAGHAH